MLLQGWTPNLDVFISVCPKGYQALGRKEAGKKAGKKERKKKTPCNSLLHLHPVL